MPPTRPLSTPCRYGYNCTRPGCYYTHPEGMTKDQQQLCSFGRSCFRKVCHLEHPNGRMMDQMRPGVDYCAACTLVRPGDLVKVSAAFQMAFPAPTDGKDRCDFVAAVPMYIAFQDWKKYRGITVTGTPNGIPSTPENIRLFPRTQKGELLLRDPAIRLGMRWSPTPSRPWKTLERMVTHDQHWEENQEMFVLCAGYEASTPGTGVCIELSVTSVVKEEDGGDGGVAGARVAREVLGLPGAQVQKWFVFHVSRPEESQEEAQFVTVKTIVDASKLPVAPRRPEAVPPPSMAPSPSLLPAIAYPRRPLLPTPQTIATPAAAAASVAPIRTAPAHNTAGVAAAMRYPSTTSPFAGSSAPVSTDSEFGNSSLSFGSCLDDAANTKTSSPPTGSYSGPGGGGGGDRGGVATEQAFVDPVKVSPPSLAPATVDDELSDLLARLNMSKFRSNFDTRKVDYATLKTLTEEDQLSGLGIPLGPRIKLMKELGIQRPSN